MASAPVAQMPMNPISLGCSDFTRDTDVTTQELLHLLDLASEMKRNPRRFATSLSGRYAALLFEKPSLRTRLTFELAMKQLGGDSVTSAGLIGEREPLKDIARNLDRWVHGIVARVFTHRTITELAQWSKVPVVNALCDKFHPCQALADVLTVREHFGYTDGLTLAFIGDGNNVAHSLLHTCVRLGMNFRLACPKNYEPDAELVAEARAMAPKAEIVITNDPYEAVDGAHAVYTDVWASMGQEAEAIERRAIFHAYQVNSELMAAAAKNAVFMHCLPAKRQQETTDDVMESPQSVVFDQAENRLHTQKALLLTLLQ
ncbi:ornithine carbamoyltransferase, catabolic [Bryobacterales bacterium F-183]|nr:ornithine carbamoyltransferase, catabolic [Bryobacterales bacterium F-183]